MDMEQDSQFSLVTQGSSTTTDEITNLELEKEYRKRKHHPIKITTEKTPLSLQLDHLNKR